MREFGQYRIESLIGRGGMGEVHQAYDTRRDRQVALKLLPNVLSEDPEYQRRFRRESYTVARLREPHVIPIHDYGEIDNRLFIDMRLVDGRSLAALLAEEGALPPQRAVALVAQVADALDAAHGDGLVHRDVKPSNILVTPNDFVYVVDFGIAHAMGQTGSRMTMTGATIGTLDYMAPERFGNRPVDRRTDVYSLACVLFECLTGTKPFPGADLPALMYGHLFAAPPRPSAVNPMVAGAFDAVIARGMAKEPDARFGSAGALAAAARAAAGPTGPAVAEGGATAPAGTAEAAFTATEVSAGPAEEGAATDAFAAETVGAGVAHAPISPVAPAAAGGPQSPPVPPGHPPDAPAPAGPPPADDAPTVAGPTRPVGLADDPPTVAGPTREVALTAPPDRRRPMLGTHRNGLTIAALAVMTVAVVVLAALLVVARTDADASAGGGLTSGLAPVKEQPGPGQKPIAASSIPRPTVSTTVQVGPTPGYMEISPDGRSAYIANRAAGVLTVFDMTRNQPLGTIPVPDGGPQFIAFSPDGSRAYVSIFNNERTVNEVGVLDTATQTFIGKVPTGVRPFALEVTPDGKRVYVPNHDSGSITVIDTASLTVVHEIKVAPNPHWLAVSTDGTRVFAANHESNVVTVIDTATDGVLATIPVGLSPHSIVVHPKRPIVINANYDANTVSVIDRNTDAVLATVPTGNHPQDVTLSADGKYAYLATVDDNAVQVMDTATYQITASVPTGRSPTSVAVAPDGRHAYVTNLNDGTVTIINTAGTA